MGHLVFFGHRVLLVVGLLVGNWFSLAQTAMFDVQKSAALPILILCVKITSHELPVAPDDGHMGTVDSTLDRHHLAVIDATKARLAGCLSLILRVLRGDRPLVLASH